MSDGTQPAIEGTCDPRFESIRAAFRRNFAENAEVGAAVCVTVGGQTVVDLWGGVADPATGRPWTRDTIGVVWSCTKGRSPRGGSWFAPSTPG